MRVGLESFRMKESLSEYIPRKIMQETLLDPRYRSIEKIGSGSFGEIHKVYDTIEKKLRAVKIEKRDKRGSNGMLMKEAFIMQAMKDSAHFPRLIDEASTDSMQFVIMSLLGSNLETLKKKQPLARLSHYTTMIIGSQMIEALQLMHAKGFLHRDIKPENFVIGTEGSHHNIYIIDFGLSKKFIDLDGQHIPQDTNKGLIGTARYTSVNSHKGFEQSRRDDLEALGYVLIYLARGDLPWQNLNLEKREEKFEAIQKLKSDTDLDDLTQGLPSVFKYYMENVRQLDFEDEPDYKTLINHFLAQAVSVQKQMDIPITATHCLDWCSQNCSIQRHFQEKIDRQVQADAQILQFAKEDAAGTGGDVFVNDFLRRQSKFSDTENFYSDTLEKPINSTVAAAKNVPMFRSEQSLKISRCMSTNLTMTVGGGGGRGVYCHNNFPSSKKHNTSNNGTNMTTTTLLQSTAMVSLEMHQPLLMFGSGFQQQQLLHGYEGMKLDEVFSKHSLNSSQYNNAPSEYYTSQQDEAVVVQKIVTSTPIQLSSIKKTRTTLLTKNK